MIIVRTKMAFLEKRGEKERNIDVRNIDWLVASAHQGGGGQQKAGKHMRSGRGSPAPPLLRMEDSLVP